MSDLIQRLRTTRRFGPDDFEMLCEAADALEAQHALVALLRASLRQSEEEVEGLRRDAWQPIEAAPKTGRTLLLGYPNALGKWRTVRGEWISQACIDEQWEEPDDAEPGWYETSVEADDPPNCWPITPTHWMPLPSAPVSQTKEQS